jgi:hypothetical protein
VQPDSVVGIKPETSRALGTPPSPQQRNVSLLLPPNNPERYITPEGFPLAYEVLAGNTADKTTLKDFLARIEQH